MNEWANLYTEVRTIGTTELGRIAATFIIAAFTTLGMKLVQKRARMASGTRLASGATLDIGRHRRNFVLAKNMILVTAVVIVCTIWASKIAGAALSLAAVAGATLIVSKEFLANLLGGLMLAISKPYGIGDFIELEGISGRVVDSDMLVTTIAETMESHQLTGRTVSLPHSLLLVRPVRNLTATGNFVINIMSVAVHPNEELLAQELALLKAASIVCAPWMTEADEHLRRVASRDLIDLPTAEPRVLIKLRSAEEYTLALRYCCRPNDRVKVEQAITRIYLRTRVQFHVPIVTTIPAASVAPIPTQEHQSL